MIAIQLNLDTGIATLPQATIIKAGGAVPVQITLNRDPAGDCAFQLSLGPQSSVPTVLAYLDVLEAQNATVFLGRLDANDARLMAYLAGKQTAPLNCELAWTLDGERQIAPNTTVTVQPPQVVGPQSSEGGPVWPTPEQIVTSEVLAAALAAALAPGDIRIPDRDNNNTLSRLVIKDGQLQLETIE